MQTRLKIPNIIALIKQMITKVVIKDRFLNIAFMLLLAFYAISLILEFLSFDFDYLLGILDKQLFWQGLSDLSMGKVIYRDFYWEYGFLYLAIGLPFFFLLNKTFFASIFIALIIFPVFSIFLSFLLGKKLLNKKLLLLFLFLLFLYGVNRDFTSLRHLIPEFGLLTLILGIEFKDIRKVYIGSIFLGTSLLSSLDYGIAANLSAAVYFLISLFRKQSIRPYIYNFLATESVIVAPCFIFLWRSHALRNMAVFFSDQARSFYYNSPCREFFPRLSAINTGIEFFQRLNLYFVPLLFVLLGIWLFLSMRRSRWFSMIFTLIIYSTLIFYRPITTPCLGYMNYGLLFLFFILIFVASLPDIGSKFKYFLRFALIWFIILPIPENLARMSRQIKEYMTRNVSEKQFLPIAGIKLNKELADEYLKIVNFIRANSYESDSIFVYPHGPYCQLAQRRSAVSIASSWHYDLSSSLIKTTLNQLEKNKPKLIVINTYNANSLKTTLNSLHYGIYSQGDSLIYEGIRTPVEDYICSNYKIVKKFKLAWILQKRNKPAPIRKLYLPIDDPLHWKVETQGLVRDEFPSLSNELVFNVKRKNPVMELKLETFNGISRIRLPIKVDLGLTKMFSKYIIIVAVAVDDGNEHTVVMQIATSDWQDVWINLPSTNARITGLLVYISRNHGFLCFGKPKKISLKYPEAFTYNQYLKIDGKG